MPHCRLRDAQRARIQKDLAPLGRELFAATHPPPPISAESGATRREVEVSRRVADPVKHSHPTQDRSAQGGICWPGHGGCHRLPMAVGPALWPQCLHHLAGWFSWWNLRCPRRVAAAMSPVWCMPTSTDFSGATVASAGTDALHTPSSQVCSMSPDGPGTRSPRVNGPASTAGSPAAAGRPGRRSAAR